MLRQVESISLSQAVETLGPADHGRILSLADYRTARGLPGFVYELIDGALVVSPNPVPNHDYWLEVVREQFSRYARRYSGRIAYITEGAEIEIPRRMSPTRPRPDLAIYKDFPHPPPASWDDVSPLIVVEVISNRRAEKDTVRNRHLYWQVRSMIEYLVVNPDTDPLEPTLIALRRNARATAWEEHMIRFGKTYKSVALPGLSINLKEKSKR